MTEKSNLIPKIYFWITAISIVYSIISIFFIKYGHSTLIQLITLIIFVSLPTIMGLYGYAYEKAIFKPAIFKIAFYLLIILVLKNIIDFIRGNALSLFFTSINVVNIIILRKYAWHLHKLWLNKKEMRV